MQQICISQLVENPTTKTIYLVDSRLDALIKSIEVFGVLEPLIVFEIPERQGFYQIVSGNRRKLAATRLKLTELPCTLFEPIELSDARVVAHQEFREKSPSDIIRELRILREDYGLVQGVKVANNPALEKAANYKKELQETEGKAKIDRLRKYDKLVTALVDGDENRYQDFMRQIDVTQNISGAVKQVQRLLDEKNNEKISPQNYEVNVANCRVLPKSSADLSDLEDESVQMGICSPPYFKMRDFNTGEGELGQEESAAEFIRRLVKHFNPFKRVLKPNGTLWVNLGDYVIGPGYDLVPERFAIAMMEDGWMLHDRIIWAKHNPIWSGGNRCVISTESILIFKKSWSAHFDLSWLMQMNVVNDKVTIGRPNGTLRLRSFFDFRDNVLITATANNAALRAACLKEGLTLTHSATFPISVPVIAIMTGSSEGDTVVDHFSGTATTGEACILLGRSYVGYEPNPTYMRMGEVRLRTALDNENKESMVDESDVRVAA
jgi:DNA modification methylase